MRPWGDPARRMRLSARVVIAAALAVAIAWADADAGAEDPWETMNRGIFRFNEGADRWVIEPIAKGVDFVTPDPVERSIRKFFKNSMFPIHFLNDLLQAKPVSAVEEFARFVVNTTVGVAGFFDPATSFGLESHREDFGQTLPSNPRDTIGLVADSAAAVYPYFIPYWVSSAIATGDLLNRRSLALDAIAAEREAALDYYVAVRNAHQSYREDQVRDSEEDESDGDDLYYPD